MLRRRLRPLTALVALVLVATACGGDDDGSGGSASPPSEEIALAYDVGGLGDQGVNDAALLALTRAGDELGVTVQPFEPDDSGSDREDLLRLLADQDYGLVIAVGAGYRAAVEAVAAEHPDRSFAIIDDPGSTVPNVVSVDFAEEEAAYLAGAAATLSSTSRRVAFLGGQDDARTQRSQAGFKAGVIRIDPKVHVDVAYVGAGDPKQAALALLANGADVVYGVPGTLSDAVFAAAKEHGGVQAIGADTDRSLTADPSVEGIILTSMVKDVESAVYDVIETYVLGDLEPGPHRYGLDKEALSVAASGSLSAEARTRLDELRDRIVDLQIQVPSTP